MNQFSSQSTCNRLQQSAVWAASAYSSCTSAAPPEAQSRGTSAWLPDPDGVANLHSSTPMTLQVLLEAGASSALATEDVCVTPGFLLLKPLGSRLVVAVRLGVGVEVDGGEVAGRGGAAHAA